MGLKLVIRKEDLTGDEEFPLWRRYETLPPFHAIVYSIIVYIIDVNIGLYAGIIALVILIYGLRWITPDDKKMTKKEIEELGKKTIACLK